MVELYLLMFEFYYQARRNRGGWGEAAAPPSPQIFAKFDLLPIDNDSEKKEVAKNI